MANLKDVAKMAGVSVATVSQALNGKSVNEQTRVKVLDCAEKLHYVPNKGGRSLITGKTNTILMVVINSRAHTDLIKNNSFFYSYMMGIIEEAEKRKYSFHLDVRYWEDPDLLGFFRTKCRDKSSDGMIIIPQYNHSFGFQKYVAEMPHVYLSPCHVMEGMNYVMVEHEHGGRLLADLFLKKGLVNPGILHGPVDHYDAQSRENSFLDRFGTHGLVVPDDRRYYTDFTMNSGYEGARDILSRGGVDSLLCCNDYVAAGAMKFCRESGLSIPDDIAVAGYDNIEISKALSPDLTTIDAKLHEVGIALAGNLFRQIENGESNLHKYIRPELIIRESL